MVREGLDIRALFRFMSRRPSRTRAWMRSAIAAAGVIGARALARSPAGWRMLSFSLARSATVGLFFGILGTYTGHFGANFLERGRLGSLIGLEHSLSFRVLPGVLPRFF